MPRFYELASSIERKDRAFAIIDCKKNKCPDHFLEVLVRYENGEKVSSYEGDYSKASLLSFCARD